MSKPPKASRTVGSARQKPAKSFAGFLPIVRLKWPPALANTRARIMRACAIAVCRVVPHKHSTTAAARKTRFRCAYFSRFAVNRQFNALGIGKWSVSAPLPLHY